MDEQLEGKTQAQESGSSDQNDSKGATAGQQSKGSSGSNDTAKDVKAAREIKGNLTYSASPGSIKNVLDALIVAERPDRFSNSFLESILGQKGGGARSVPPVLKKMGFLQSDGTPTDLYSKFRTDYGRPEAAYSGLRNAFGDLFKKNEYVYKVPEDQLKDYISEITGLKKNDPIVRLICSSFSVVKEYIPQNFVPTTATSAETKVETTPKSDSVDRVDNKTPGTGTLSLAYHINLVLPESQDQMVYDAIFKSLKRHLLQ
jgi:hypothetical protein